MKSKFYRTVKFWVQGLIFVANGDFKMSPVFRTLDWVLYILRTLWLIKCINFLKGSKFIGVLENHYILENLADLTKFPISTVDICAVFTN